MGSEHSTNNRQEEANKQADWEKGMVWEGPAKDGSPPENREGCAAQGQGFAVGARLKHVAQPLHSQGLTGPAQD